MDKSGDLADGDLMGLVRKYLYVPDGKAPLGPNGRRYNDGRDVTVIRALRRAGLSGFDIAAAIEGLRLMCDAGELGRKRPGEKLTMRALYNTGHGVRPLLYQAQEAVWRSAKRATPSATLDLKRAEAPVRVGDLIDRILPKR